MSNPIYPFDSAEILHAPQTQDEVQRALGQIFGQHRGSPANQQTAIVRCGIYDRLSKVDPTSKQYSLDIQTDQAMEFARARGWEVAAVYSDPVVTGRHSRRQGLQQAQPDAKTGLLDALLDPSC